MGKINKGIYLKTITVALLIVIILSIFPTVGGLEAPSVDWSMTYGVRYATAAQLIQTTDNGYALVGSMAGSPIRICTKNFLLVKTDPNGTKEWDKTYGGNREDDACSLIQIDDGGYVLLGYTNSYNDGSNYDVLLIKTNSSGDIIWSKTSGGLNNDQPTSLIQTNDGGYAIAGHSNYDLLLIKTDPEGNITWIKIYDGKKIEKAESLIQTEDGGFALAGETNSYGSGSYDFWLVKTDPNGTMEWNRTYGGKQEDSAYSIIQTEDGGFALAGETNSYGSGSYDFWLVKTDPNGTMEWNRTYGGKQEDSAYSIIQTEDGGFALSGRSKVLFYYDFFLVKTDSNGYMEWYGSYSNNSDASALSLIQTQDEGYVVAGYLYFDVHFNFFMIKTNKTSIGEPNLYPISYAGTDENVYAGENVSFNGTGYDPDGKIVRFRWDFNGDGVYDWSSNTTESVTYVYNKIGTYNAILEVTDNNGSSRIDMRKIAVGSSTLHGIMLGGISGEVWIGILTLLIITTALAAIIIYKSKNKRKPVKHFDLKYLHYFMGMDKWLKYLVLSFLVIIGIKFTLSFLFHMPCIHFDEHSYGVIANNIFHGKLTFIGDTTFATPYPAGYPYFLAPSYLLGNNMDLVYRGMLFINCVLTSLLIFPVFFIMKFFVNKKISFMTSILIAFLPAILAHNYLLMSENAFYLMFLVSCFLLIKTFTYEKLDRQFILYSLLSGLSVGFLSMIKASGIAMLASVLCVFVYKLVRNRKISTFKYGLIFLPFLLFIVYIFFDPTFAVRYSIPKYIDNLSLGFSDISYLTQFLNAVLNEINYFVIMSYIIFMAFTIFLLLYWKKLPAEKKESLFVFVLYGLFSVFFLIIITANHIYRMQYMIYSRYVSVGLPIIFMLGVVGMNLFNGVKNRKANLHIGIIFVLLGLLIILFFPVENYNVVNNLDLVWIINIRSASVFGVNGFTLFRIFLGLLFAFIFTVLILRYYSKRGFSILEKPFKHVSIFVIVALFLSLIVYLPSADRTMSDEKTLMDIGGNLPGRWLMQHDPVAHVILEDSQSALFGSGMNQKTWTYMYAHMSFWFPNGEITVMNRNELNRMVTSGDVDADYILSTHDLTQYYRSVEDIYMNLHVDPIVRQTKVDWHIYEVE